MKATASGKVKTSVEAPTMLGNGKAKTGTNGKTTLDGKIKSTLSSMKSSLSVKSHMSALTSMLSSLTSHKSILTSHKSILTSGGLLTGTASKSST